MPASPRTTLPRAGAIDFEDSETPPPFFMRDGRVKHEIAFLFFGFRPIAGASFAGERNDPRLWPLMVLRQLFWIAPASSVGCSAFADRTRLLDGGETDADTVPAFSRRAWRGVRVFGLRAFAGG
jgi:hypothetical protein